MTSALRHEKIEILKKLEKMKISTMMGDTLTVVFI